MKMMIKNAICFALAFVTYSAWADKHEVVSNLTNATFLSSGIPLATAGSTPADKIFSNQTTAALMYEAHHGDNAYSHGVSTILHRGIWSGSTDAAIIIKDIDVNEDIVELTVEERFLVYTNTALSTACYYDKRWITIYWNVMWCDKQKIVADQLCEPPAPWTTRGNYAPYCRDEMTNRVEHCESYANVSRTVIGYYDADGDGYATLSRVGIVKSPTGDYLDERADGDYWIMNDVVIVKYTIPRNSYLNYVYGQEDAANHYWRAKSSLYSIHLETTPLKPWWKMPEYQ